MLSKRVFVFSQIAVLCAGGCGGHTKKQDAVEPDELPDADGLEVRDSGTPISDASIGPAACRRTPGSVRRFLLTISTKPFPAKPLLMTMAIEFQGNDSMQLQLQFLDYSRAGLIGVPLMAGPFPLQPDGLFRTDPVVIDVPGEANCPLPDTAMALQITMEGGAICDDTTFACGIVNGVVLGLGVDLDGSTFTAQRIQNNVFPAPVLNCERIGVAESCK